MHFRHFLFCLLGLLIIFCACVYPKQDHAHNDRTGTDAGDKYDSNNSGSDPAGKWSGLRKKPLHLVIQNLAPGSGPVRVGVFGSHNKFPDGGDQLKSYQFIPHNGKIDVEISDLKYGEYAFAVYHDANNNGEIDKNGLGFPIEPFGFSNNIKPLLKPPSFNDCRFRYNGRHTSVTILLNGK